MRERHTVRLLVIDERDRILLFEIEEASVYDPTVDAGPSRRRYWITPGGGVEPGEDDRAAGLRELWEETGIRRDDLGPCVWERDHLLVWDGEPLRMRERFHLIRVPAGEIALDHQTIWEREIYRSHHWWTADELTASTAFLFPAALRTRIAPLLAGAIPDCPIVID